MIDVLLPGSGRPYLDLIFTGLPHPPQAGEEVHAENLTILPGGSLTSAIILRRLGFTVLYEAQLGRDFASRLLLEAMEEEGLSREAITVRDEARACVTVAYNQGGDRSFISYEGPALQPNPALIDRYQPRAVLLDGIDVGPEVLEVMRRARRIGALCLADTHERALTFSEKAMREVYAGLDVLFCNEREACGLMKQTDPEIAARLLAAVIPTVVLKQGARGALAIWPRGAERLPAIPAAVVDLTGCGDNFVAAFTAALLEGCLITECLARGNAAGFLAAQAPGGLSARYSTDDLLKLIRAHYGEIPGPDPLRGVTLEEGSE